jgi:hypothetical protein
VLAREGTDGFYIHALGGGGFLARQGGELATWAQSGAASTANGGFAGSAAGQWPKAARPSGTRGCGAWHRPTGPPASRTGNTGWRMDRWAW